MTILLPDLPKVEQIIIEQTNVVRAQSKLGAVVPSLQLMVAARAYAQLLATTGQFSHEAGGQPAQRIARAGYVACGFAENIAMRRDQSGFKTQDLAKSVVDGWLKSPVHASNVVRATMTEIGVGVAQSPKDPGKYVAVQVFGRPQSQGLVFDVKNATISPVTVSFEGHTRELAPNASYGLKSCSTGPLTISSKTAAASLTTRLEAANGNVYTVTNPFSVVVTARKP